MSVQTFPPPAVVAAAEAACVFGYPIVLMERTRVAESAMQAGSPGTMHAPPGRLVHAPGEGDANTETVRNAAWLDLASAPIVLSVPPTYGRYYVLSMLDMWSNVFASLGPRTTGTGAGTYAICGPGSSAAAPPAGAAPINAPTSAVRLLLQTHTDGADGAAAARAVQERFQLRRAGDWRRTPALEPVDGAHDARAQVDALGGPAFVAELARLIADHPPGAEHQAAVQAVRSLGSAPREAVEAGVARGLATVRAQAAAMVVENGGRWAMRYPAGHYGLDYPTRAGAAYAGLGDLPAADELCAVLRSDDQGCSLSGRHRYLLRFTTDALPPVRAFWSLSAGDGSGARHLIGNPDGLALERDGSLHIRIQRDRPAQVREPNWLRTPPGGFDVMLRMFWPMEEVLDGRWSPPAVTRVG